MKVEIMRRMHISDSIKWCTVDDEEVRTESAVNTKQKPECIVMHMCNGEERKVEREVNKKKRRKDGAGRPNSSKNRAITKPIRKKKTVVGLN